MIYTFLNHFSYFCVNTYARNSLHLGKITISILLFSVIICCFTKASAQSSFEADSIPVYILQAENSLQEYKFEEALKIAKKAYLNAAYNNDNKSLAKIYKVIGNTYELNRQKDKAVENYHKALIYASSSQSKHLASEIAFYIGDLYIKSDNDAVIDKGFMYNSKALKIATALRDTLKIIRPLLSMGKYYMDAKNHKKTYTQYLKPIKANYSTYTLPSIEKSKYNQLLARYFLRVRNYKKAIHYIEISEASIAKEIKNTENNKLLASQYHQELAATYKIEADVAYAQKEFRSAYKLLEKHQQSLLKSQDLTKQIELQTATIKFEVDQLKDKAKEADTVIDENFSKEIKWQISFILGIIIILISLAFLISSYRNNIHKKKLNNVLIEKNKELITAKETAEQVSTLKSQFISTVSHELRTPLYGVIGLTSLLMENPEDKKKGEYLESLKFSGDYLLALINDVLQLSKIETKEVKLEKVSFDLKSLIEGIVNSLHSKQKNNNNVVHIQIDPTIKTTLLGDSVRLSQILINLVGNSLKFTKNGNIWIKVKCLGYKNDQYQLHFAVKDDGIGIPKSKQATIFDNFAQVKNQNIEYEGTGLGLSIVRKLIHLHDSEIYIDSEEGVGSEFSFELRYEKAVKAKDEHANSQETISIGTTNFNILIVDDNKINQIVTQNILKKKGYTCDLASNGMDAIEMIKKEGYDLALMDINMPEMTGLDATKVIRTFNNNIPIIALTAVEEGEIRDQALSVGMNDVIIKPYDTQQFFQTIMKNISNVKYIS